MSGIWLISYIALWILVVAMAIIVLGLVRQLGVIHLRLGPEDNLLVTRDGLELGSISPNFHATDVMSRKNITLEDLQGRQSVLIFVSPSCSPCQELLVDIKYFQKSKNGKINIIVISQSDFQTSMALAREHKLKIPVIADSEGLISNLYQVRATPFAYRLDEECVVQRRGIVNNMDGLESLLEEASPDEIAVKLPNHDKKQ
jgi:methylamine dehydrogenase accessory protein MauD